MPDAVLDSMKILVVDDHVLIRDALRGVLKELAADATIMDAADARQATQLIADNPDLDLVVLDLVLPDRSGFEVLAGLRKEHPAVSVVVLSATRDREEIVKAFDLGAVGYIPKSAGREVMLTAFGLIFSGSVYVPPEILDRPQPLPQAASSARPPSAAELGMTERQMQVLSLMMQGMSNKAICRALDLAEPTVKNHVTAILRALKATNRTEAVIAAAALRLSPQRGGR